MIISIKTGKKVIDGTRFTAYFMTLIKRGLGWCDELTHIELMLTDDNGKHEQHEDISCRLEALIKGKPMLGITNKAGTYGEAVAGAIDKMSVLLKTSTAVAWH